MTSTTVTASRGPLTLGAALRLFLSHPSPFILTAVLIACVVTRVALGGFGWVDAAVVLGILVGYPFFEWLIHVFVLHLKPITIGGVTFEVPIAKGHRLHHERPWDVPAVFISWRIHLVSLAIALGILAVLPPDVRPWVLTGLGVLWGCGLAYEWVHFVAHVPYKTRSRRLRELQRLHRLHHFKSEKHWYGVAATLADRVLGTSPDPASVETSPTCRTLD